MLALVVAVLIGIRHSRGAAAPGLAPDSDMPGLAVCGANAKWPAHFSHATVASLAAENVIPASLTLTRRADSTPHRCR
jgi:hypothetical protein